MKCIFVSSFLRDIDVHLSTLVHTDIPCEIVKSVILSTAIRYSHVPGKVILTASDMVWRLVTCKNNITVNVGELRRDLARIRCSDDKRGRRKGKGKSNNKKRLSLGPRQDNAPPLPKGYVRVLSTSFPADWSPSWARTNGWIKDPYYDWMQPASSVTSVLPSKPSPAAADGGLPSWVWVTVILLALVATGYGVYWGYHWYLRNKVDQSTDVDRAFLNMPMSMSMGPIDEMPNTTDLMNDFANQSSTRAKR
jgi:hypothetical protein